MQENNWQAVWNKRKTTPEQLATLDDKQLVLELKRLDGYDVGESAVTYEAFVNFDNQTLEYLSAQKWGG